MTTPVIFRADREAGETHITAVFPTIPGSPGFMSCYAHVGQHGSCSHDWYRQTRPARAAEYADLKAELESIGYDDLKVYRRITHEMRAELRATENRYY